MNPPPVRSDAAPFGWRRTLVQGLVTVVVVAAVTGVYAGIAAAAGLDFQEFSKDPAQVLDGPWWSGSYAMLVMLVWQVPATVALLSALLLFRVGRTGPAWMLLTGGVLTAAMVLDDVLLLHDGFYPQVVGIPEKGVYLGYALGTIGFAFWFRKRLGSGLLLVGAAWMFWGMSVVVDIVLYESAPYVVEDGSKAVGVGLWFLLVVRLAVAEVLHALRAGGPARGGNVDSPTVPGVPVPRGAHRRVGSGSRGA